MAYSTEENQELWNSFIEGDLHAFSIFYKKNYPMLFAYGLRLQMDENHARDIIHDMFVKLYTTPSIITTSTTIRSFLLVSMRNAFINIIKGEQKLVDLDNIAFDFEYAVENDFWNKDEKAQIKEKVDKIIKPLTPRQKEIIYLRFLYQMEYHEISQIMNISEQAARNLVYRTIDRIRKENANSYLILLYLQSLSFS
ncbi:sigma-70 family RNA polymerase sigma factor [Pedobacter nyackensis]|uniref:RNA polymerase sigma factor n=1 Tax=Pedobacter nyackensis TaxID=475255 RepID=UPI00292DCC22|nr:sigma-70 family RNA polymerase sigma factor [Pedobacter nyackensis]